MQRGGSLTQTAYALLSDLVAIARASGAPATRQIAAQRGGVEALDDRSPMTVTGTVRQPRAMSSSYACSSSSTL